MPIEGGKNCMTSRALSFADGLRLCVMLCCLLPGSVTALAYEEITVSNGATVTGTVQFVGELPQPARFELRRYYDRVYCGALSDGSGYRLLREVTVGDHHGLKDVV